MDNAVAKISSSDRHLAATIGRNTFFGIAASGVQVATRLVLVPVIIQHLGLSGYGVWSIILTLTTYMRVGGFGVNSAVQKYVAEATANRDFKTANALLSTGAFSMLGISAVTLIPTALFSHSIAKMLAMPDDLLKSAAGAIGVLACVIAFCNFGAVFHAIVAGGHRLDLLRKFNIALSVAEAVAIILLLRFGGALCAMAIVMGTSEIIYLSCCYIAAHYVVPEIRISIKNIKRSTLRELVRFAGSYQLVNICEMVYSSILPLTVLRLFGADAAGVYAVAMRVVNAALMAQDAMVLPMLSGATLVFAGKSAERATRFVTKSFKVALTLALPPLAFACVFGTTMVLAWTGQTNPLFGRTIWLVSLAALFAAISRLQAILYRASGKALLDSVCQVLRIVILLVITVLGRTIGFYGMLQGLCAAEMISVIFMFVAIGTTFRSFSIKSLVPDTLKVSVGTAAIILAGLIASFLPTFSIGNERVVAAFKLGWISLVCLLAAWPALTLTKSVSTAEGRTVLDIVIPERTGIETAS